MIPANVLWARRWSEFSTERFDDGLRWAVLHAISESRSRGHHHVGVEHLFAGCVRAHDSLFRAFEPVADPVVVIQDAMELAGGSHPQAPLKLYGRSLADAWAKVERAHREGTLHPPVLTPRAERVVGRAEAIAGERDPVRVEHLFAAVLEEPSSVIAAVLQQRGVPRSRIAAWIAMRAEWGPLIELAREAAASEDDG